MTKSTKEEVNYSRGMMQSHCGKAFNDDDHYCEHFRGSDKSLGSGTCTEVEGEIRRVYWCELFKRVKK